MSTSAAKFENLSDLLKGNVVGKRRNSVYGRVEINEWLYQEIIRRTCDLESLLKKFSLDRSDAIDEAIKLKHLCAEQKKRGDDLLSQLHQEKQQGAKLNTQTEVFIRQIKEVGKHNQGLCAQVENQSQIIERLETENEKAQELLTESLKAFQELNTEYSELEKQIEIMADMRNRDADTLADRDMTIHRLEQQNTRLKNYVDEQDRIEAEWDRVLKIILFALCIVCLACIVGSSIYCVPK